MEARIKTVEVRFAPIAASAASSPIKIKDDKLSMSRARDGPANREPAVRQGPVRLRLHRPSAPPDQTADPPRRRAEAPRPSEDSRPGQHPSTHFREASLARGARPSPVAVWHRRCATTQGGKALWLVSARPRARTRKRICSRSWCALASAPTMSTTAPASATPPRWRR